MATPIFPKTIPGVSSLNWGPTSPLTTDGQGPKSSRRLSEVPSALAQVSWNFLEDDFSIFMEFWEQGLNRGHRWFLLPLPCAVGYYNHVVRFKSYHSAKSEGFNYRIVSADLEVRERIIRLPNLSAYVTSKPYPLYDKDSFASSAKITGGRIIEGNLYEFHDAREVYASITGGSLTEFEKIEPSDPIEALQTYRPALMSLELKTVLYEANAQNSISRGASITGGKLVNFVVTQQPTESINASCVVISGTLE